MAGMVIMEDTGFDEECQSTAGGKPLMSISSMGESSDRCSEMSEQKSSTSSSSVKDTCKLHIHRYKACRSSSIPLLQMGLQRYWHTAACDENEIRGINLASLPLENICCSTLKAECCLLVFKLQQGQ